MEAFVDRNRNRIVLGLIGGLLLALILTLISFIRVGDARARAAAAEAELESVRNGVSELLVTAATFTGRLNALEPAVSGALDEAVTGLDSFAGSTIEFMIPIDQEIPVSTEFVFERTIDVPVQTTLPIDESIETTIVVAGPLGVDIPVDVTVPVVLDLPIDITFPLTVNETIPIETSIPVRLDVPIAVPVADSELATLATSLRDGLVALQGALADLGG